MADSIRSLIACGTKLWLDSIDPELLTSHRALGATGATSNPVIVADLIKTGRFDTRVIELVEAGQTDEEIAWNLTDELVYGAQQTFLPVWQETHGNDGYVSFEVDPLLEDPAAELSRAERVRQYVKLGKRWARGHQNRMIKVPATAAGLEALEPLAAAGVSLNVTLIFTELQYRAARDAIWRGAQQRESLQQFKSVYSIFISRIDVYTQRHLPGLAVAQGLVGIVNAQHIWQENRDFWRTSNTPLDQEIVFASTGVKNPEDNPCKYVAALAGSDIQTNPPATNDAVSSSGHSFEATLGAPPETEVVNEIRRQVNFHALQETLLEEGIRKFVDPHKSLLGLIREKRMALSLQ